MKPINMKTWEVQAILDNRKTVARREVKPQPVMYGFWETHFDWSKVKAPYRPGDILYVRETWFFETGDPNEEIGTGAFVYKADYTENGKDYSEFWRSLATMPKEAARIFLRVTGVRVERLQEIKASGAIAEGVCWEDVTPAVPSMPDNPAWDMDSVIAEMQEREERELIEKSYGTLWDSALKPKDRALYGWEANPWVWGIEFEKISREESSE